MSPSRIHPALLVGIVAGALLMIEQTATAEPVGLPQGVQDQRAVQRARTTLVLTGLGSTAVWYGASVGMYYAWPSAPHARDLWIPVAGPWMSLSHTGCDIGAAVCQPFVVGLRAALSVLSGLGQAGGLALAVQGLLLSSASPGPTEVGPPKPQARVLIPYARPVGQSGISVGVIGQF